MKSVTLKLFLLIAVAFIAFLTLGLVFETAFFGDFYINTKISSFKTSFCELTDAVHDKKIDEDELAELLDEFSRANNARTTVIELLSLPAQQETLWPGRPPGPRNGIMNGQPREPMFNTLIETDRETMRNLIPVLEELSIPPLNGQAVFEEENRLPGNYLYGIAGVSVNGADCLLFSSASMQPVGEAVSALKSYYIYIYIAAIVSALIISLVVSGILARPLIAANNKLSADLEKEKRLDAIRKDFIASASHELKTPIGLISGYVEALRDGVAPDEKEQFLAVIADETSRMGQLVREMLELCMLQDDHNRLRFGDIEVSILVEECLRKFSAKINEKSIVVKYNPDGLILRADAVKIEQALTNVLDNAIRYTPEGGAICVAAGINGVYVELSVENEGPHISEQEQPRIWESFYRGDRNADVGQNTADGQDRGQTGNYGIGLAIVRQAAELHGGEAYVENTPTGVKFGLLLPQVGDHKPGDNNTSAR